jgi:hypothetical protein
MRSPCCGPWRISTIRSPRSAWPPTRRATPSIPEHVLRRSLLEKQQHAHYMATQMCFDADKSSIVAPGERAAGVTLPLVVGIPGSDRSGRLVTIGARIGVGQSLRYLRKNRSDRVQAAEAGPVRPDEVGRPLAPLADSTRMANAVGLHVFTFNQIASTAEWYEKSLCGGGAPDHWVASATMARIRSRSAGSSHRTPLVPVPTTTGRAPPASPRSRSRRARRRGTSRSRTPCPTRGWFRRSGRTAARRRPSVDRQGGVCLVGMNVPHSGTPSICV